MMIDRLANLENMNKHLKILKFKDFLSTKNNYNSYKK